MGLRVKHKHLNEAHVNNTGYIVYFICCGQKKKVNIVNVVGYYIIHLLFTKNFNTFKIQLHRKRDRKWFLYYKL